MQQIIPAIIISYLLGAIPTAYLFGRLKGIDIRNFGSGNIGATNALRVLGKKIGLLVLAMDILKGLIAVTLLGSMPIETTLISREILLIIIAIACICGHNWTIFLRFKGGKGVATTLGVLLGLSFEIPGLGNALIAIVLTWFLLFIIFRIVSLASVISGMVFPFYAFFLTRSLTLTYFSLLLAVFVILRHKANLKRLIKGQEPRLNFKKQ